MALNDDEELNMAGLSVSNSENGTFVADASLCLMRINACLTGFFNLKNFISHCPYFTPFSKSSDFIHELLNVIRGGI